MANDSPISVLVDESGNIISVILDGVTYRLQTEAKLATGSVVGIDSGATGGLALNSTLSAGISSIISALGPLSTEATLAAISALITDIKDTDGIKKITDPVDVSDRVARLLGHVTVDASALPTGAATEVTLATRATEVNQTNGNQKTQVINGSNTLGIDSGGRAAIQNPPNLDISLSTVADQQTDGTQKSIIRGGTKGATTPADLTSTTQGADHQSLDVQLYHGGVARDPKEIRDLSSFNDSVTVVPSGTFNNQQSNVQLDYDTGAGSQSTTVFGIALPASGGAVAGGTSTNPVRVDPTGTTTQPVSITSVPLPTGAATSANQTNGNQITQIINDGNFLDINASGQAGIQNPPNLDTTLSSRATEATLSTRVADATITARLNTLGQKTMANSAPVVIASDQSTFGVDVTDRSARLLGHVTVDASALPTGASTSANQTNGSQKTQIVDGADTLDINASGQAAIQNPPNLDTPLSTIATEATLITVKGELSTILNQQIDGTQKSIVRGGDKGSTVATDVTSTAEGANHQSLDVQIYHGGVAKDPTQIRAITSSDSITTVQTVYSSLKAKVQLRNPGDTADLGDSANPVRVDPTGTTTQPVSAVSLPLPTGAATETTLASRLADATFTSRINTLGQKVMASSTPVVIASNQSVIPVSDNSGSLTVDTPQLPAVLEGGRLDTNVGAWLGSTAPSVGQKTAVNSVPVIVASDQSVIPVSDNSGSLTVDTPQLPAALVGSRLDTNVGAWLGSTVPTVGSKTSSNSIPVVVASDQSVIPVSDNAGSLTVDQGTYANLKAQVQIRNPGDTANMGDLTNPVRIDPTGTTAQPVTDNAGSLTIDTPQLPAALVGSRLDTNIGAWLGSTAPTVGQKTMADSIPIVLASDQSVILVKKTSSTATTSTVAGSASSVQLLASNSNRLGATIFNDSTQLLYLKLGTTASTTDYTIQLGRDDYYEIPYGYTGRIDGIWASASGNARITELT